MVHDMFCIPRVKIFRSTYRQSRGGGLMRHTWLYHLRNAVVRLLVCSAAVGPAAYGAFQTFTDHDSHFFIVTAVVLLLFRALALIKTAHPSFREASVGIITSLAVGIAGSLSIAVACGL